MPKRVNSASRLFHITREVAATRDELPMVATWGAIFGMVDPAPTPLEVCRRLLWLEEEIVLFLAQMRTTSFSEHLYLEIAEGLRRAGAPTYLNSQAQHLKRHCPESLRKGLEFCADGLPDEEEPLIAEDLEALQSLIAQLRELAEEAGLSPTLAAVVRHHINLLELALAALPIKGLRALVEATRAAAGDLHFLSQRAEPDAADVQSAEHQVAVRLRTTWLTVVKIIDHADKVRKVLTLGHEAYDWIHRLF